MSRGLSYEVRAVCCTKAESRRLVVCPPITESRHFTHSILPFTAFGLTSSSMSNLITSLHGIDLNEDINEESPSSQVSICLFDGMDDMPSDSQDTSSLTPSDFAEFQHLRTEFSQNMSDLRTQYEELLDEEREKNEKLTQLIQKLKWELESRDYILHSMQGLLNKYYGGSS